MGVLKELVTSNGVRVKILDDMLRDVGKEEMARRESEHMRVARQILMRYAARLAQQADQTNA